MENKLSEQAFTDDHIIRLMVDFGYKESARAIAAHISALTAQLAKVERQVDALRMYMTGAYDSDNPATPFIGPGDFYSDGQVDAIIAAAQPEPGGEG